MHHDDIVGHLEYDDPMVAADRCTGRPRLVPEQTDVHGTDKRGARRSPQSVEGLVRRTTRGAFAGPAQQVDGGVEAQVRVPSGRVEVREARRFDLCTVGRAGQYLDRGRRRRIAAGHHRE
ncbi:hypothetical protein [Kribbella sp. VKM Ac-2566]|uniref:hypothetical protein n=1 Tax=Kribbella sp. VKM Ac-2566 TaxID=2512218 RepID=UPI00192DF516|nr:hypothetical protein [Kribbella sp. VKM Ac-2566]